MRCFRCQNEWVKDEAKVMVSYVAVNIGRDKWHEGIGDIHVYICQKCCGELVKFLKGSDLFITKLEKEMNKDAKQSVSKGIPQREGTRKPLQK